MKQTRIKTKLFAQELAKFGFSKSVIYVSKKDAIELFEDKEADIKLFLINKEPAFFYQNNQLIPTIKFLQFHPDLLKKVTVDMGAIKFVAGGADIMRPGIKKINPYIKQDEIVAIVDETYSKAICLGQALFDANTMLVQKTGKSLKNIHFIGDKIWNFNY